MLLLQALELRPVDGERLCLLERGHRRRAARTLCYQRHLAETLPWPAYRDRNDVAERRHHPNREATLLDQVQRVARIVTVKDDLVPRETATARDLQQLAYMLRRHTLK
jgi:hypothetical protein